VRRFDRAARGGCATRTGFALDPANYKYSHEHEWVALGDRRPPSASLTTPSTPSTTWRSSSCLDRTQNPPPGGPLKLILHRTPGERQSITEHSFHGLVTPPLKGNSVTYVSGTVSHPLVGSLTDPLKHRGLLQIQPDMASVDSAEARVQPIPSGSASKPPAPPRDWNNFLLIRGRVCYRSSCKCESMDGAVTEPHPISRSCDFGVPAH
jgi:hypothetical protein